MNSICTRAAIFCASLVAGFSCVIPCQADLVLVFNPTTKTAAFSGTTPTTITPFDFGSGSVVNWSSAFTISGGATSTFLTNGMATYNSPTPVTISNSFNNSGGYFAPMPPFANVGSIRFSLSVDGNTPPAPATITGNGTPVSYAGFNTSVQNYIESFTSAAPLVLTSTQTSSTLTVYAQSAAVPEASAFLCVGLVAACYLARARQRASV